MIPSRALASLALAALAACAQPAAQPAPPAPPAGPSLAGAWKSSIKFQDGALAAYQGLEFMYVFNAGGTMTESSNYDAAPPVPPAYGLWRATGPNSFEARYQFYLTRQPTKAEAAGASGGWVPAGFGILTETITLAADGNSFTSAIKLEVFDPAGKPAEGGGTGTSTGRRITF